MQLGTTMRRGLRASGQPPFGRVVVPASKSQAIRALVLAAINPGPVRIGPLSEGDDVRAALAAVEPLGGRVEQVVRDAVDVRGRVDGPLGTASAPRILAAAESGTLARVLAAVSAFQPARGAARVEGVATLARRRSAPLFRALERAGAGVDFVAAEAGFPVLVTPVEAPDEIVLRHPSSSQEVSALLIALAGCVGARVLRVEGEIPSRPYLDLTLRALAGFSVPVEEHGGGELVFHLCGPPRRLGACQLEADASLAAVALAAAALRGGELEVSSLRPGSPQGDVRIARHLAAFGCNALCDRDGLRAGGKPTRGARLDLAGEPDLAPLLAALAADVALRLGLGSRLSGLETLPRKESDRLDGIATALRAIGLRVEVGADSLAIGPGGDARFADDPAGDIVLDPRGDHRLAFMHALLGLVVPRVFTSDAACVRKTWPAFWEDMQRLGFGIAFGD